MQPLQLSLLQTDLIWENPEANRQQIEAQLQALPAGTHLIVLPEMFSTGFSMNPTQLAEGMEGETVNWMKRVASDKRCILTGSFMAKEGDQYFNRLLWVLPNGQIGQYDKRHLFAFAGEDQHYTPGNKRLIASVNGWRIHLQICYDLRFPVWARQRSTYDEDGNFHPEYDVLINVANWPERRSHHWKTLLQARAIENQCFVVGVNRVGNDGNGLYHSGDSMVIDPLGQVLYHKSQEEDVHTTILEKSQLDEVRTRLPFWKDGDHFLLV